MKLYNNKDKIFLAVFLLLGMCLNINAQISAGGEPFSFKNESRLQKISEIPTFTMPSTDNSRLRQQDNDEGDLSGPLRFATTFDVDYDLKEVALSETLSAGGEIYRLALKSTGAFAINVHFDQFVLAEGAQLYIYNKDKTHVIGAYTSKNNKVSKNLPIGFVKGEEIIIEYFEPANITSKSSIHINRVGHDYRNINGLFGGPETGYQSCYNVSFGCHLDVACPEASGWESEIRAVSGITYYDDCQNATYLCTGSLINNTKQDRKPYYLTADHCIDSETEANSALFYFNYESPDCGGSNGSVVQSVAVSTLIANYQPADMTLVELSEIPPTHYNVSYAGWNRSSSIPTSTMGIHHPRGDVKKISYSAFPPTDHTDFSYYNVNYNVNPPIVCLDNIYPGANFYNVVFDQGLTEVGSSGSPLFNSSNQIVGQLSGGPQNNWCGNSYSIYGKLQKSWNGGGTPETRLKDWLDPLNLNYLSIETLDFPSCPLNIENELGDFSAFENGHYTADDYISENNTVQTDANIVYDAGQNITLTPGFEAESGSVFCGLINGCTTDILSVVPQLENYVNSVTCCENITITYWHFDPANPSAKYYAIYIQSGSNCDFYEEFFYYFVEDDNLLSIGPLPPGFNVNTGTTEFHHTIEPGCIEPVFESYPWLLNIPELNNCCPNTTVSSVYTPNGYHFLYVDYGPTCERASQLYLVCNQLYCTEGDVPVSCYTHFEIDPATAELIYTSGSCRTGNNNLLQDNIASIAIQPNPAKDYTNIVLNLIEDSDVTITLFDIHGREVKQVVNAERFAQGIETISLDSSTLATGTYLCKIQIGEQLENRKISVMR